MIIMGISLLAFISCGEEYEDGEVIRDTYSGTIHVTSGGEDPAGDFTGSGDSGIYSFAWRNPQSEASLNLDITTNTGSVQMILRDSKDTVVLDKTLNAGGVDSYSGVSDPGESGIWTVKLIITDFNGDGSYSLHPGG